MGVLVIGKDSNVQFKEKAPQHTKSKIIKVLDSDKVSIN